MMISISCCRRIKGNTKNPGRTMKASLLTMMTLSICSVILKGCESFCISKSYRIIHKRSFTYNHHLRTTAWKLSSLSPNNNNNINNENIKGRSYSSSRIMMGLDVKIRIVGKKNGGEQWLDDVS